MLATDTGVVRAAETDEEFLIFDVSDDTIERAAPIIGGVASVVTLNFGTGIVGNCGCPCMEDRQFDWTDLLTSSYQSNMLREHNRAMDLIPAKDAFKNSLATLPLVTYQPGETVIADGSRTGRLLILRKGTVAIVKEDTEIAKVAEPGAVFGELSVLLDQPHTADVRALETSQFHVADATTLLTQNPVAVLYVAATLAHRLDGANHTLIQLKHQLLTGEPHSVVAKTVSKMEGLLVASASLVYAGYPYDPFA